MFRGHFEHAVDDKGRVAIPARFREALSGLQEERLVVTKFRVGGQRCLDVYPLATWRKLEEKVLGKNRFDAKIVRFKNFYVSGAHECSLDAQGRILVPPLLRDYAGIERDVMFTGDIDMFRLWDKEGWQQAFTEDELAVLDNPDFLSGLDL
ncbi:MAG: division/cell wall cluster transcriptional repressor MraZ [Candidatus Binatia bacterium]